MFCPSCGTPAKGPSKFCSNCGALLPAAPPPAAAPAPQPPAAVTQPPAPAAPPAPAYQPPPPPAVPQAVAAAAAPAPAYQPPPAAPVAQPVAYAPQTAPPKKKSVWPIVLLIVGVIFVLVIATVGYVGYRIYSAAKQAATSAEQAAQQLPSQIPSTTPGGTGSPVSLSEMTQSGSTLSSNGYNFKLQWQTSKDGPERPAAVYRPGDTVYLHVEVTDYKTQSGNVDVSMDFDALDPQGNPMFKTLNVPVTGNVGDDPSQPVIGNFNITLPSFAMSGVYKAQVTLRDNVANQQAVVAPAFVVDGMPIVNPSGLEIRDFVLSNSRDGDPVDPPTFSAGSVVHARMRVYGTEFQNDRPDVVLGYKIYSPDGSVALDDQNAAAVTDEVTYRPASLFIDFRNQVDIPAGAATGSYTEEFTITDKISGRTATQQVKFEVH